MIISKYNIAVLFVRAHMVVGGAVPGILSQGSTIHMAMLKMQYSDTSPFLQTNSHKPLKTGPVKLLSCHHVS